MAADPQAPPPSALPAAAVRLPVLPLRGLVAFPGLAMPLQVGRESSIAAVHEALQKDRQILLVAQRDPNCQEPGPADLFEMGSVGSCLQCFKGEGGTHKVIVEAAARALVVRVASEGGCLWADAALLRESLLDGPEAEALVRTVRARFFTYLQLQPALPESIGQQAAAA